MSEIFRKVLYYASIHVENLSSLTAYFEIIYRAVSRDKLPCYQLHYLFENVARRCLLSYPHQLYTLGPARLHRRRSLYSIPMKGYRTFHHQAWLHSDIQTQHENVAAVVPASGDVPLLQFLARGFRNRIGKLSEICRHD